MSIRGPHTAHVENQKKMLVRDWEWLPKAGWHPKAGYSLQVLALSLIIHPPLELLSWDCWNGDVFLWHSEYSGSIWYHINIFALCWILTTASRWHLWGRRFTDQATTAGYFLTFCFHEILLSMKKNIHFSIKIELRAEVQCSSKWAIIFQ